LTSCGAVEGDGITYPLSGNRISVHYVGKLAATQQYRTIPGPPVGNFPPNGGDCKGSVPFKNALKISKFRPETKPKTTAKTPRIGWYSFPGSVIASPAHSCLPEDFGDFF